MLEQPAAFLDTHCGDDLLLRQEAESLLGYPVSRDGFMEEPAFELAAKQMARELATRDEADVLPGRTADNFRGLATGIG